MFRKPVLPATDFRDFIWLNTRVGAGLFLICAALVGMVYLSSIEGINRHNHLEDSLWSLVIDVVGWLVF